MRLHPNDGESVEKWVERLRNDGSVLGYKSCADPPPPGSGISANAFTLVLQTRWQRKRAIKIGNAVLHIDGTHNVTQYVNMNLYTVLGRDEWGHGA